MLADGFCDDWVHRLGHEVSILWAAHGVHHRSEEYKLPTALRVLLVRLSPLHAWGWATAAAATALAGAWLLLRSATAPLAGAMRPGAPAG